MKTAQEIYEYHGGFTAKELADPGLCELRDRAFDLERENARLREVVADLARECDPVRNGIAAKYPELFLPNTQGVTQPATETNHNAGRLA